ncbi:VPLPA-CTERM sorting domain-containing protein [Haematobacter massiliensis]|nr:VPLPA-CTERM sorting domain-containing protein [Haematobacter massiliensis]OWJ88379.1 VPLPA-CTERM sorting domain-containing protein [Haematobacter massiliensis]
MLIIDISVMNSAPAPEPIGRIMERNMLKKVVTAALIAAASAASANAAVIYASSVVSAKQKGYVAPVRSNPIAATGAEDGSFYSLGFGGSIVLGFSSLVSGAGKVFEVTNLPRETYIESAIFSVSLDGKSWTTLGEYSNQVSSLYSATPFLFLKVEDTSPVIAGHGRDGYDIDAIGFEEYVAAVPLPAAGLLLIGGLAGLGAIKRRKAA